MKMDGGILLRLNQNLVYYFTDNCWLASGNIDSMYNNILADKFIYDLP